MELYTGLGGLQRPLGHQEGLWARILGMLGVGSHDGRGLLAEAGAASGSLLDSDARRMLLEMFPARNDVATAIVRSGAVADVGVDIKFLGRGLVGGRRSARQDPVRLRGEVGSRVVFGGDAMSRLEAGLRVSIVVYFYLEWNNNKAWRTNPVFSTQLIK